MTELIDPDDPEAAMWELLLRVQRDSEQAQQSVAQHLSDAHAENTARAESDARAESEMWGVVAAQRDELITLDAPV